MASLPYLLANIAEPNKNTNLNNPSLVGIVNAQSCNLVSHEGETILPCDYIPAENDVICGRGKLSFEHNTKFRRIIANHVDEYNNTKSKHDKSFVVVSIVEKIRSANGRFIKNDEKSGRWRDIGHRASREKVGHAIRDAVTAKRNRLRRRKRASTKICAVPSTEDSKEDKRAVDILIANTLGSTLDGEAIVSNPPSEQTLIGGGGSSLNNGIISFPAADTIKSRGSESPVQEQEQTLGVFYDVNCGSRSSIEKEEICKPASDFNSRDHEDISLSSDESGNSNCISGSVFYDVQDGGRSSFKFDEICIPAADTDSRNDEETSVGGSSAAEKQNDILIEEIILRGLYR